MSYAGLTVVVGLTITLYRTTHYRNTRPKGLKSATDNTKFGSVYEGCYHHFHIAVKMLNTVRLLFWFLKLLIYTHMIQEVVDDVAGRLRKQALALAPYIKERYCIQCYRALPLIQLMGFCLSPLPLVYPFVSRRSLHYVLHEYKVGFSPTHWLTT